jgi:DNA-binding transcriptional MerR regulator
LERTLSSIVKGVDATLTISDAAAQSGISAHTLRYWERAGLLQPVGRNGSGHRRYAEEDLDRIKFLTKLRATGMPIRQVRRYAELLNGGDKTNEERLALLEAHRGAVQARLEETVVHLELIDWKIDLYRERLGCK